MRVIVITRPDLFDGEHQWINALFRVGLGTLHLRKPSSSLEQVEALLCQIEPRYRRRIVLHDHLSLAEKYSLGGIHLNSRNSTPPASFKGSCSRSCHSLEEIEQHKATCDYLTLSPILDSISKQGYTSAFTRDMLLDAMARGIIDDKVVAMGGIAEQNIAQMQALGFGGVALLGDVWHCRSAHEAACKIVRINHLYNTPKVLSIAGSDPSGGAGIQADIKTITSLEGYAATAITSLTVQNTLGVTACYPTPPQAVTEQIISVVEDIKPQAIKIGMVGDEATVQSIADTLQRYSAQHIVYDPVMISTSGHTLVEPQAIDTIKQRLIPMASLLTPNRHEAEALWQRTICSKEDMERAAEELHYSYGCAVLIKGGHMEEDGMCDVLCDHDSTLNHFYARRIATRNLHGTGCTLSSAIATLLARGLVLHDAIDVAKRYITEAIAMGSTRTIGAGNGPLWHGVGGDFLMDYLEK